MIKIFDMWYHDSGTSIMVDPFRIIRGQPDNHLQQKFFELGREVRRRAAGYSDTSIFHCSAVLKLKEKRKADLLGSSACDKGCDNGDRK